MAPVGLYVHLSERASPQLVHTVEEKERHDCRKPSKTSWRWPYFSRARETTHGDGGCHLANLVSQRSIASHILTTDFQVVTPKECAWNEVIGCISVLSPKQLSSALAIACNSSLEWTNDRHGKHKAAK